MIAKISFLLIFCMASAIAKPVDELVAFVNKTEIEAGESIILTVEFKGKSQAPSFSELSMFNILSRQQGHESSFINGNFSQKTRWTLEIQPKSSEKEITIPAISLGAYKTKPITVKQGAKTKTKTSDGIFLVVYANKDQVYVNAQLIINVELKTSLSLRNGALSEPDIKDAILEPLVVDEQSDVVENGIQYRVFKRSYAVFPKKAGELLVSAVTFSGVAIKERDSFPGFFSSGTQISAQSHPLIVKVLDIPESYPKDVPFLPLKRLSIADRFDGTKFEVNQAVTRRFNISALGTLSTFLPKIIEPQVKDLQIYSEEGQKDQRSSEDGILVNQQVSQTYMPTNPRQMHIPEQVIYWWNTDEDKLETTIIEGLEVSVLGKAMAKKDAPVPKTVDPQPETEAKTPSLWPWFFLALILLSLLGIFTYKKGLKKKVDPIKNLIKDIISSCDKNDEKRCFELLQKLSFKKELSLELLNKKNELEKKIWQKNTAKNSPILSEIKKLVRIKEKPKKPGLEPIYPK